ncbi:MAG TPA: O-antigen ligase family protein [Lacunisphaera sp.]
MPVMLQRMSGGLLAMALVAGPLNYASIRPAGLWLLIYLLGAAALCWAAGLVLERRIPATPLPVVIGLFALTIAALFWLSGFAPATSATEFTRVHLAKIISRWPHSVVDFDPATVIALHAGLGLALWITCDLARDRAWMCVIATVICATGAAAALVAIAQNITHATGIYWQTEGAMPGRFWGPFFHHTSAGAYLNTVWPLAAGFVLIATRPGFSPKTKKIVLISAGSVLILLLGAHTTHISRFPQLAAVIVAPFFAFKFFRKRFSRFNPVALLLPVGIAAIAVCAGRTNEIARRWHLLHFAPAHAARAIPPENTWPALVRDDLLIPNIYDSGTLGDRGEAQRTALRAIAARPLEGHGPGNWSGAASRHSSDPYVRSFYLYLQFAHDDFLQTWTEWGAAGFVCMVTLLPGAIIAVSRSEPLTDQAVSILGICAAAGLTMVLLQSLLDFPLQIPAVSLNASVLAGLGWSTVSRDRA